MLPVLFQLGPLKVHAWGVLLMLGFLLAVWRAARNGLRYQIAPDAVWDVSMWGLFGGILGARLVYVLVENGEFRGNFLSVFHIWEGGMSFHGGLFGGILAGMLVCRARKINIGDMADLAAVSFPIGYALGRVGCFLNGCCYGSACDLPWAVRFHLPNGGLTPPSHPAQLYSALISVGIYFLLVRMEPLRRFRGQIMLSYIFLYCAYRFFIEWIREGATSRPTSILGMTHGQVASVVIALLAAALWGMLARRARLRRTDTDAPAPRPAATPVA